MDQEIAPFVGEIDLIVAWQIALQAFEQIVQIDVDNHDAHHGATRIRHGCAEPQCRFALGGMRTVLVIHRNRRGINPPGRERQRVEHIRELAFFLQAVPFDPHQAVRIAVETNQFESVVLAGNQADLQVLGVVNHEAGIHLRQLFARRIRANAVVGLQDGRRRRQAREHQRVCADVVDRPGNALA